MIEPRDRLVHGLDRSCIGRHRPTQHDHLDTERARRGDLAVTGDPAAILGDHRIDPMRAHERAIAGLAERSAIGDVADVNQRQRRVHRIDAADQIIVLRRRAQRSELAAAERDKDSARANVEEAHCLGDIRCFGPAVAGSRAPWRTAQSQQRHTRLARRGNSVAGYDVGIGMGRIDQGVDPFIAQIVGKSRGTAEAAAAHRRRLQRRRFCASGQRYDDFQIRARCQAFAEFARFRRAAEDEDA